MENAIKIHVIIPVYNAKQYLQEAVGSVLNQPYKGIDLVLVNDGSTDGSDVLCDEIASVEQRVIALHQKNSGVSAARNTGIEYIVEHHKDGGYVAFLDADDAWLPESVDFGISDLLLNGYDIVGLQSCLCNANMTMRSEAACMQEGAFSGGAKNIWLGSDQHFASMLYSLKLFETYHLRFPVVKFCEDKMFRFRAVYLAESIFLRNKLFYLYRNNPGSLVHTRPFGIRYFPTIINAYLDLNSEMLEWKNEIRGELTIGRSCAIRYIMEMQREHYQSGGSTKAFGRFLQNNPQYPDLLIQEGLMDEYQLLINPPFRYIWSNRIRGWMWKTVRAVSYLPAVRDLKNRKRYPVKM